MGRDDSFNLQVFVAIGSRYSVLCHLVGRNTDGYCRTCLFNPITDKVCQVDHHGGRPCALYGPNISS
ncbi:MAG: hypothetical protein M2R45_03145 [Verrucomicrobia subdivision 3 bacterium]|nr:hypothetical protein [Limisphaerales bacterium]MCS1413213.1 hypothetical protein [Limisphaerales bacterium]